MSVKPQVLIVAHRRINSVSRLVRGLGGKHFSYSSNSYTPRSYLSRLVPSREAKNRHSPKVRIQKCLQRRLGRMGLSITGNKDSEWFSVCAPFSSHVGFIEAQAILRAPFKP